MAWIARPKTTMGTLERRRAKRVARVVEVRWSGRVALGGAGVGGVGVGKGVGEEAWEEGWEEV